MKAVFVALAVALAAYGVFLSVASSRSFCSRVRAEEEAVRKVLGVLEEAKRTLDMCASMDCDLDTVETVTAALFAAGVEDIVVEDVSSGINEMFWPEKVLDSPRIAGLLEKDECVAEYGWANSIADFRGREYPIANRIPLLNVYEAESDLTRALCSVAQVKDESKIELLLKKMEGRERMDAKEILKLLSLKEASMLASFFGTKTAFWRVSFKALGRYRVYGVFAAIPENPESAVVREYRLVERRADVLR